MTYGTVGDRSSKTMCASFRSRRSRALVVHAVPIAPAPAAEHADGGVSSFLTMALAMAPDPTEHIFALIADDDALHEMHAFASR